MPTYTYACAACKEEFDRFQWYNEGRLRKCPSCGKFKLERLIGTGSSPIIRNITTVGQAAEANAKRVGKEKLAKMAEKYAASKKEARLKLPRGAKKVSRPKKNPWWRSGEVPGLKKMDMPLDVRKIPDVQKYIKKGE